MIIFNSEHWTFAQGYPRGFRSLDAITQEGKHCWVRGFGFCSNVPITRAGATALVTEFYLLLHMTQ